MNFSVAQEMVGQNKISQQRIVAENKNPRAIPKHSIYQTLSTEAGIVQVRYTAVTSVVGRTMVSTDKHLLERGCDSRNTLAFFRKRKMTPKLNESNILSFFFFFSSKIKPTSTKKSILKGTMDIGASRKKKKKV